MKNVIFLLVLAISAGLNIYLYQRFASADRARQVAQQHFADCQQVTFQLQNQLSQEEAPKSAGTKETTDK